MKSLAPIHSHRRSSLLEMPAEFDVDNQKETDELEIGDDDTPPAKRSPIADVIRGNVVLFPKLEVFVCRTLSVWPVCSLGRLISLELDWQYIVFFNNCLQSSFDRVKLGRWRIGAITNRANLQKLF